MAKLTAASVIGVILALIIIYLLRPLNNGAVALILLICVGLANVAAQFVPGPNSSKSTKKT
jgi:hypothetical protein